RNTETLEQTAALVRAEGLEPLSRALDLSDPAEIEACFAWVRERGVRLNALINNAGLGAWKSVYDLSAADWDYVLNTNLRGTFLRGDRQYRLDAGAHVRAELRGLGGILALTHALALSLGPDRIRVNAISPGWIENGDYAALRPVDHAQHPAQRVGRPDDIARACLYLTDPENDFVTGANLVVDGGMTRKMMYEE
ncbi:unnamed protein product, partial [Rhizoctonia solani]